MGATSMSVAATAAACAVVAVMVVTALITKRSGKAAYVDAAWGASFVAATWVALVALMIQGQAPTYRAWILTALVTFWGVRLTWHLARRVRASTHDDPRYEKFLGGAIAEVPFIRVLTKVFALQAVLVIVVSLPLVVGLVQTEANPWWIAVGCVVWLVGVAFEAVSDAQLATYQRNPRRPRILMTGLWSWSRHPNYFGDFCVWWGFWLVGGVATGVHYGLMSAFSPVLMSWILIGVSGVRLAEKRMTGRPGWTAYAARTPIFFPFPPVRRPIR